MEKTPKWKVVKTILEDRVGVRVFSVRLKYVVKEFLRLNGEVEPTRERLKAVAAILFKEMKRHPEVFAHNGKQWQLR